MVSEKESKRGPGQKQVWTQLGADRKQGEAISGGGGGGGGEIQWDDGRHRFEQMWARVSSMWAGRARQAWDHGDRRGQLTRY